MACGPALRRKTTAPPCPPKNSGAPAGAPFLPLRAAVVPRSWPDLNPRPDPGAQARVGVVGAQPGVHAAVRIRAGASALAMNHGHLAVGLRESVCHASFRRDAAHDRAEVEPQPGRDLAPAHAVTLHLHE